MADSRFEWRVTRVLQAEAPWAELFNLIDEVRAENRLAGGDDDYLAAVLSGLLCQLPLPIREGS